MNQCKRFWNRFRRSKYVLIRDYSLIGEGKKRKKKKKAQFIQFIENIMNNMISLGIVSSAHEDQSSRKSLKLHEDHAGGWPSQLQKVNCSPTQPRRAGRRRHFCCWSIHKTDLEHPGPSRTEGGTSIMWNNSANPLCNLLLTPRIWRAWSGGQRSPRGGWGGLLEGGRLTRVSLTQRRSKIPRRPCVRALAGLPLRWRGRRFGSSGRPSSSPDGR